MRLLLILLLLPSVLQAAPLKVFVSILPLQTFVERVGGPHVTVHAIIGPGQDPHNYSPSPKQIQSLSSAALYIHGGGAFEQGWSTRIRQANPSMAVINAFEHVELRPFSEPHQHHHDEAHHNEQGDHHPHPAVSIDPHAWTSPLLAQQMVRTIEQGMSRLNPAHQDAYRKGAAALISELEQLHQEIEQLLESTEQRAFMVFHPVWGYFAHTYGLQQIAIEDEGKAPSAQRLVQLISEARTLGVKTIFVQPQMSRRAARQIANAIDGEVVVLDPLAADYLENLRHVSQQLIR